MVMITTLYNFWSNNLKKKKNTDGIPIAQYTEKQQEGLETSSEDDFFHQAAVEELCRGLLQ
jgi:hypothetical protein